MNGAWAVGRLDIEQMDIFLHTTPKSVLNWKNVSVDWPQLPRVGEHIMPEQNSEWYRVQLVVHMPFRDGYEVYAVEEPIDVAMGKVFPNGHEKNSSYLL